MKENLFVSKSEEYLVRHYNLQRKDFTEYLVGGINDVVYKIQSCPKFKMKVVHLNPQSLKEHQEDPKVSKEGAVLCISE